MPCPDSLLQQGKECWAPPSSVGCQPEGSARGYEQTGQAKKKKTASEMSVAGGAGSARTGLRAFLPTSGKVLPKQCGACIMREVFQDQHKKNKWKICILYYIYISFHCKKTWATWILIIINCIGLMPFGFDFGSAVSFSLSGLETKLICTRYVWELFNHDISQFKISGQNISWWSSGVCRLIVRALMSARTSSNFLRWSSVISTWSMSNSPALSGSAGMEGVEERQEVDFLSR